PASYVVEGRQSLGAAAAVDQGPDAQRMQPLSPWMGCGELVQAREHVGGVGTGGAVGVVGEYGEFGIGHVLDGGQAELVEASDHRLGERRAADVAQRRSAPQLQRFVQ